MKNIALLSEIHPLATHIFNPITQANDWYKVFSAQDIEFIKNKNFQFHEAIQLIYEKLSSEDKTLVIRDWTHFDYFGIPFIDNPQFKLLLAESLNNHFSLFQVTTVRHPIDQYISTKSRALFAKDNRMNIPAFLSGYLAFAKKAESMGFIRYEDFTREPDKALKTICTKLRIDFDPGYNEKWHSNTHITGDTVHTDNTGKLVIPSRGLHFKKIKPVPRKEFPQDLPAIFRKYVDYYAALEILGYEDL